MVFDLSTVGSERSTRAQHARMAERDYKAGFFVDLAWKGLGRAAAAGAETAVGRDAWTLYGQAREAGLGKLDTSGLHGLLEPKS